MRLLLSFFLFWLVLEAFQELTSFWLVFLSAGLLTSGILVAYFFEKNFSKIYIFASIFSILLILFIVMLNLENLIIRNLFIGVVLFFSISNIMPIFRRFKGILK